MSTNNSAANETRATPQHQSITTAPGVERIVVTGIPSDGVLNRSINHSGRTPNGDTANRSWPVCQTRNAPMQIATRKNGRKYASHRLRVRVTFSRVSGILDLRLITRDFYDTASYRSQQTSQQQTVYQKRNRITKETASAARQTKTCQRTISLTTSRRATVSLKRTIWHTK